MTERHPIFERLGRFTIDSRRIWNGGNELTQLFARIIVLRCEQVGYRDAFEYVAAGPDFQKIERGDEPNYYIPQFRRLDDGSELFQGFAR
jgi:hypothetical protein